VIRINWATDSEKLFSSLLSKNCSGGGDVTNFSFFLSLWFEKTVEIQVWQSLADHFSRIPKMGTGVSNGKGARKKGEIERMVIP